MSGSGVGSSMQPGQPGTPFQSSVMIPTPASGAGVDPATMERASALFDSIDRNGDGIVTRAELEAALAGQSLAPPAPAPPAPAAQVPVPAPQQPQFVTMPAPVAAPMGPAPGAPPSAPVVPQAATAPPSAPVLSVFPTGKVPAAPEGPAVPPSGAMNPPSLPMMAAPMPSAPSLQAPPQAQSMPSVRPPVVSMQPTYSSAPPRFDEDARVGVNAQMSFQPSPMTMNTGAPSASASFAKPVLPQQGANEMGSLFNFGKKEGVFLTGPADFMRIFPTLFTIFTFVIFIIPIWLTYHVGRDGQVRYWIGALCSDVLLLPILYLVVHLIHVNRGRPSKPAMVACLIGSCVLILVIADYTLLAAYGKGNLLKSKDCVSFEHKQDLQLQWENAKVFYRNCMTATAEKSGLTYDAAVNLYRIEDCIEYEDQKGNNPGWDYLADLEETYSCSGWCVHDQPLWTFKAVKDSCSQVVADVMFNKVQWTMTQVVVYTLIVLGFTSVGLLAAGPVFKAAGYEW